ncbi:ATP-binding protein [Mucilaginibacter sp. PAMB04168]|uniref:HAMP domain-containing sensor histidine kinase n=1 Tax=Mucilaginibacter sp. PAMB04168 TaxID=3138567 RepID=UPI0031F62C5D
MKIKTRLSLYFTLISCGALLFVLLGVYIAFYTFSKDDFTNRLSDRIKVASKLYLEADEISKDSLVQVQQQYLEKLPDEVIRVYDESNRSAFNATNGIYWKDDIIKQVRKEGQIEYEEGKRQVLGKYYKDNQGNFVIMASAIDRNFSNRTIRLGKIAAVFFVIFSTALFFAGQWLAKNTLQPIQKVVGQMRQVQSSNLHLRIQSNKNKDEIAELISNFNSLLERLQNAFELQQSFVSNASHELRTPLTSILGEVDVALDKQRTVEEYERVLRSVSTDAMHLQDTITSLMELAQVDFNYTQALLSPLRIDELLWELQEHWLIKKGQGLVNVSFSNFPEDENELIIQGNKPLLHIAFNNIIDNAFKYSAGAPVGIRFDSSHNHVRITVTDTGPGIKPSDSELIFKSFYRADHTSEVPGTGVGLYIASKIIQLCNGTIQVVSDGVLGSSFVIGFAKTV